MCVRECAYKCEACKFRLADSCSCCFCHDATVAATAAAADEANNSSLICVCHDPFIPRINFSFASHVCVCTSALKC